MTVKPLSSTAKTERKPQGAVSYGMSFAVGFWLISLFFVPPVVVIGLLTYAVLKALF